MIILGVTGSVGMGKTEAGKYFIRNNIDVFDCDKKIATFYNKKDTIIKIKQKFPTTIFNNKVDKNVLAKIVFNDKLKLKFLEELLHRKLKLEQSFWLRRKIREKKKYWFSMCLCFLKKIILKNMILLWCSHVIKLFKEEEY